MNLPIAMVIWSSTVLELDFLVLCPPGAAERRSKHSIANSLISRGLLLRTLARGFKPKTVNQSSIQTHFHGTFGQGLGSLGVLRLVHLPQACRMNPGSNILEPFDPLRHLANFSSTRGLCFDALCYCQSNKLK